MGLLGRRARTSHPAQEIDADRLTLKQLEAGGANLSRARHVIHILYFSEEADARAAAAAVERAGWKVALAPPTVKRKRWRIRAEGMRVVDRTTVGAFRTWFERVATEWNGSYDGWEAAAKP